MNLPSRGTRVSPKVVGALVLVGAIYLAYLVGQWVLVGGIRGVAVRVGGIVGVVIALAVLVRWRRGILLFLFWLTFEDLFRKYAGNDMYIYFVKDALLAVIYAAFFIGVTRGREKIFRPKFWVPMLALFCLALAQVFNPRSTSIFYGLMGMKIDFYYVPLVFLGYAFLRTREDLDRFVSFSLKTAIVVALVGIIQGLGWKTFLNPAHLAPALRELGHLVRYAPGLGRTLSAPPSVFVSQGRYANYLELMFTLGLGAAAFQIFRRGSAKLAYLALGVMGIAIFMSGTKGALVYAILTVVGLGGILLWGVRDQPWIRARLGKTMRRSVIALVAGLVLFVSFYPNLARAWSTYYYDMLWPDSPNSELAKRAGSYPWNEFQKSLENAGWQWGYGTGTASLGVEYVTKLLNAPPPAAHGVENGFGNLIIEWGVLGPIFWVLMATALVIAGWKVTRRLASTSCYPLALAILWFAFWVLLPLTWGSLTTYQNYIVNAYLWTLVGVLFRLPALASPTGNRVLATPIEAAPPTEPMRVG